MNLKCCDCKKTMQQGEFPLNRGCAYCRKHRNSRSYRCKECSRVRTRANWAKKRKLVADEKVARGACMDCGLHCHTENWFVFDFDHRPGERKAFALGKVSTQRASKIKREMTKCDLVCSNCHRLRTRARGQYGPFPL